MSKKFFGGARARALGLASTGLLVTGLAAAMPTAQAAEEPTGPTTYDSGRYVVLLREAPAASYAGDDSRYPATRPTEGGAFRADSRASTQYRRHLEREQDRLAREVGTEVLSSFTVASNGFVAELSADEALDLATDRRVLLVAKDVKREMDTWETPDSLGLTGRRGAWKESGNRKKAGAGTVVGILDSGYWPESPSFAGKQLTSAPQTKWDITMSGDGSTRMEKADGGVFNGACETGEGMPDPICNTKVVGARYYSEAFEEDIATTDTEKAETEFLSARDGDGHGTHTASTAAGALVKDVSVEGRDFGKLSGMAPGAALAIYKVCWEDTDPNSGGCYTSASLDAIDDAVADGVDSINYSISGATDTVVDAVEVAFEGAAEAGVFIAASAGNSGPDASTVAHNSPWLTTVASTTHVNFENTLVLGDGQKFAGASIAGTKIPRTPLVDAKDVALEGADPAEAELCAADTLDPALAEGLIVVCKRGVYARVDKSAEVARAGGVASVLVNPSENSLDADFHVIPTIHVDEVAGEAVYAYLESAGDDAAARFALGNRTDKTTPLPQVSGFSSRGPAVANESDILKPDIAAPGSSVLAAVAPPTNSDRDYDLYSGTSMAAPHIAGLAAFMQGLHPDWTPQEIQSAMMTTAKPTRDSEGAKSTDALAQGAGIVNPKKFLDPGWFISSSAREWRGFLTGQGLDTGVPALAPTELNLPSIAQGQVAGSASFTRTLQSSMKGTWNVRVDMPGFTAEAPATLVAGRVGDIEELPVTFTRTDAPLGEFAFGKIVLSGPTKLRIPVALRPVSVKAPLSAEGTGTEGSTDVTITPAQDGELEVVAKGLAKAMTLDSAVEGGQQVLSDCIEVPEGVDHARFDLDAVDDTADLDLYVYAAESCDPSTIYALAGQSATGSADERVDLTDPAPGAYYYEIDGYAAGEAGSPIEFVMDTFLVTPEGVGDLTVDPNPVVTTANEETTFEVSWTGLEAGTRYLGLLEYAGALAPTVLEVDTTE